MNRFQRSLRVLERTQLPQLKMEEIASLTLAHYSTLTRYSPIDAAPAFSDPPFPASECRTLTIRDSP